MRKIPACRRFNVEILLRAWGVISRALAISFFVLQGALAANAADSLAPAAPAVEVDVHLTEQMREAIQSGIPLGFKLTLTYITPRLLLDNHSLSQTHDFKIERHRLSNQFLLWHNQESRPRAFTTLSAVSDYLASTALILTEQYVKTQSAELDTSSSFPAFRLAFDKYALPGPVRLTALWSSEWEFDTGWIRWESVN